MSRAATGHSRGQILYEVLAEEDKTRRHLPEYRDLTVDEQTVYENAAARLMRHWQDHGVDTFPKTN